MDNNKEIEKNIQSQSNTQGFNPLWALFGMGLLILVVLIAEFFGLKAK